MSQAGNQPGAPKAGEPADELASLDAQLDALLAEAPKSNATATSGPAGDAAPNVQPGAPIAGAPAPESAASAAEDAVKAIEAQVDSLVSQFVDAEPAAEGSLADLTESLVKADAAEAVANEAAATPDAPSEPVAATTPIVSDPPVAESANEEAASAEATAAVPGALESAAPDALVPALGAEPPASDAVAEAAPTEAIAPEVATSPAAATEAQATQAVADVIESSVAQPAAPESVVADSKPAPFAGVEVPGDIAALDDQLARLTDELLAGDADAGSDSPAPSEAVPAPSSAPASPSTPEAAPAPAAETSAPAVVAARPAVPASAPAPVSAPTSAPNSAPNSAPTSAPAVAAAVAAPSPVVPAKPKGPSVFTRAREAMGKRSAGVAAALAKPLAGKPKMVRDTVGWIGLNTIFLATLVWGYRLMLQKPEQPVAAKTPIGLISGAHDSHDSHGAAADEHGEPHAEEHSDDHAVVKGDPHDAADDHAVPKSGLGAATALTKKKLTYALSDAMAAKMSGGKKDAGGHGEAKKDDKKDAKKSGGH
jgi:hypothetical protein